MLYSFQFFFRVITIFLSVFLFKLLLQAFSITFNNAKRYQVKKEAELTTSS